MKVQTIIFLVGSILIGESVLAKPPEEVCDPLKESTSGLYGLCVAFCGNHPPGDLGTLDLSNVQTKLLKAYNSIRSDDDPEMPCFQGCPCFSLNEAVSVANSENYYRCTDYFQREVFGTWYESWQSIRQAGDLDQFGNPQTSGEVSAYEAAQGELTCAWQIQSTSPIRMQERYWFSPNEEDRAKFEDCQAIIDYVVYDKGLECETLPECERRILIEYPTSGEKPTLLVNGALINDPNEECVNNSPIARIEWYWGDGSVDVFEPEADGYLYPFPNSHTYVETGLFVWIIYAFDERGRIVSSAGNFYFNW
jgi:hypothetical protein